MQAGSQQQGAEFEQVLLEFLERVLTSDLGYELLQNSLQAAGTQYGKDIQTRWRDAEGSEYFWHFECKSQKSGALHQREVLDKVLDVQLSAHRIQVWCLALAHVEPGNWLDERLTWANECLELPFFLDVLSPARGSIKKLFECHPDLYSRLYTDPPTRALDRAERERRLAAFAAFLRESTERGRRQALRPCGNWLLVSRSRMSDLPANPDQKATYLRGLTPTCPWEAVIHAWAAERASAETPLLSRIAHSEAGFTWHCIVAAGGEGKSTLLEANRLASLDRG